MDTQLHTSVCWYRFAVSGDVLADLLALEHRVHHHPSNNCKEWNIIIINVIIIIFVIIIKECTIIPPITARRAKCTGKQIEPLRERKCPQFLNPDLDPVKRKIIKIKMGELNFHTFIMKILTVFTFTLLDLIFVLHILVARLAVVPGSFHLFIVG